VVDSTLITVLTGTGVAGVFCLLFILGLIYPKSVVADKDRVIAELKDALKAERARGDASVAGAAATRDVLAAFQAGTQVARIPADSHAQGQAAVPPQQIAGPP
jgi:hypothetical protein